MVILPPAPLRSSSSFLWLHRDFFFPSLNPHHHHHPLLPTTRTIFSRSWASQSELTGVNLSGLSPLYCCPSLSPALSPSPSIQKAIREQLELVTVIIQTNE